MIVKTFCLSGEGVIHYNLNTTGNSDIWIYLFLNDDWKEAAYDTNCYAKLQKARATCKFVSVSHRNMWDWKELNVENCLQDFEYRYLNIAQLAWKMPVFIQLVYFFL